jgi:hypothetical protein
VSPENGRAEPFATEVVMGLAVEGTNESHALLQVWGPTLGVPQYAGLGTHALAFSGEVDLAGAVQSAIQDIEDNSDDADDPVTLDLDIKVGPQWRKVRTVAPMVAVTDVYSYGSDADDLFQFAVRFRSPKWTEVTFGSGKWIVLHVSVVKAGEYLTLFRLGYSVTATGDLRNAFSLVPDV